MPRKRPSDLLAVAMRAHFGLTQAELGRYLGVVREPTWKPGSAGLHSRPSGGGPRYGRHYYPAELRYSFPATLLSCNSRSAQRRSWASGQDAGKQAGPGDAATS